MGGKRNDLLDQWGNYVDHCTNRPRGFDRVFEGKPRRSVQPIMDIKEQLDFAAAQINALIEEYAPPSVKGTALIPRLFAFH